MLLLYVIAYLISNKPMFIPLFVVFLLACLAVSITATSESGLTRWPRTYVCVFASVVSAVVIAYLLAKLIN